MRVLDLQTAVGEIRQACDSETSRRYPFFFIAGAGISCPPIPLACTIEDECKRVAEQQGRTAKPPRDDPLTRYSHWMESAWPQPHLRQKYLRSLIERKPISAANLRLAHLLTENAITNLVVTTNFDDLLSRALTLFGRAHIICDHPQMLLRIDAERDDIQILHVHGSYWHYDCCNLRVEITERTQGIGGFLNSLLARRSPLVLGYSGWEGDVIMSALKHRLKDRLRSNLYWFCHTYSTAVSLPRWLTDHPNVCLVMAAPIEGRSSRTSEALELRTSSCPQGIESLDARQVLDEFVRAFSLKVPDIICDPLHFYARQLADFLQENEAPYFINSVIERIKRAAQRDREMPSLIERQVEQVLDDVRRAEYRAAIQDGQLISLSSDLNATQLRRLLEALWSAAANLSDDSPEELAGYRLMVTLADRLMQSGNEDATVRELLARALFAQPLVLKVLNRHDEALACYRELVTRFDGAGEPLLRELAAKAAEHLRLAVTKLGPATELL